jgi:DNA-binding transcriptional LysR family regulator
MRRGALRTAGREQATLTIAATHALSFTFFPGWIRTSAPLEALGTLNLVSDTMAACERILLAGDADFLLCHHHSGLPDRFEAARFSFVTIGADHLTPVSGVGSGGAALFDLPMASGEPVRYLAYSASSGLGRILESAGCAPGRDLPLATVFTSPLAAALQTMARQGHGIAWLPRSLAQDDIAAGRLTGVGGGRFTVPVDIRLVRARDRKSGVAEAFWQTAAR